MNRFKLVWWCIFSPKKLTSYLCTIIKNAKKEERDDCEIEFKDKIRYFDYKRFENGIVKDVQNEKILFTMSYHTEKEMMMTRGQCASSSYVQAETKKVEKLKCGYTHSFINVPENLFLEDTANKIAKELIKEGYIHSRINENNPSELEFFIYRF